MSITITPYVAIRDQMKTLLEAEYPREVFIGSALDRMPITSISINGIDKGSNAWAVMRPGRKPRNGQFRLVMQVKSSCGGMTPQPAEDLVMERLAFIETTLADDPTMGLAGFQTLRCLVDEFELISFNSTERNGFTALMDLFVLCEYRLAAA